MADYDAIISNNNSNGNSNPFMIFTDKASELKKPFGLPDKLPDSFRDAYYFASDSKPPDSKNIKVYLIDGTITDNKEAD